MHLYISNLLLVTSCYAFLSDVENKKTDTDQRKVNNENTKLENKESDGIEKKANEITTAQPKQEPELKKETESNNMEIEVTKTDDENKDPKAKLLNNIKERRIAVIGTHPQITTKFCNWLIGMSIFQRDVNNCQQAQVKLFRKKMKIAKTPDLASVSHPAATMKKCTDMLAPGPHVFLKLVPIDNFTAEDKEDFSQLNEWFGEKVFGFVIPVLFSKQQSGVSNGDVESYCNQNEDLNGCMQQCDGRFLAGSIFSSGETKVTYLQNLTDIIDNVISGNDGLYFEPEVAEDNDWDMVMNSYREIAGVAEPGDVKILVKEEGPVEVDPEKQHDRLKRGLDKLTGQANTKM